MVSKADMAIIQPGDRGHSGSFETINSRASKTAMGTSSQNLVGSQRLSPLQYESRSMKRRRVRHLTQMWSARKRMKAAAFICGLAGAGVGQKAKQRRLHAVKIPVWTDFKGGFGPLFCFFLNDVEACHFYEMKYSRS
jgi:hypothetical protein